MLKHLPPTPPFVPGLTSLKNSLPPPPKWCRRRGTGGCGQFITRCLCCSFLLTLFFSVVGSLPRETVLHELCQRGSFPQAADLHRLLQHGSFLQGAVLQEQTAPAWVPHGVTSPARSLLRRGLFSPQVLPEACSSTGSP